MAIHKLGIFYFWPVLCLVKELLLIPIRGTDGEYICFNSEKENQEPLTHYWTGHSNFFRIRTSNMIHQFFEMEIVAKRIENYTIDIDSFFCARKKRIWLLIGGFPSHFPSMNKNSLGS